MRNSKQETWYIIVPGLSCDTNKLLEPVIIVQNKKRKQSFIVNKLPTLILNNVTKSVTPSLYTLQTGIRI